MRILIQKESETVTPFAGVSLINNEFNASGLSKLIDNKSERSQRPAYFSIA
jgi:hypothetical protein